MHFSVTNVKRRFAPVSARGELFRSAKRENATVRIQPRDLSPVFHACDYTYLFVLTRDTHSVNHACIYLFSLREGKKQATAASAGACYWDDPVPSEDRSPPRYKLNAGFEVGFSRPASVLRNIFIAYVTSWGNLRMLVDMHDTATRHVFDRSPPAHFVRFTRVFGFQEIQRVLSPIDRNALTRSLIPVSCPAVPDLVGATGNGGRRKVKA